VANEQRALQGKCQILDQPPGAELAGVDPLGCIRISIGKQCIELLLDTMEVGVEAGVGPGAELALSQEPGQALRLTHDRPQDVERRDVARSLPDRVQRRIAVEQRHPRVLDEPVASEPPPAW
jgi:hypothetical protein